MGSVLQYIKGNSHAILATLVFVQNLHFFKGVPGTVLNVFVNLATAFSNQ